MKITFHGGVGEIGGNKVLVEDADTKIFLDFGMSFKRRGDYFEEYLNPRPGNGFGDLMEFGLIPDLKGVYRDDLLKVAGRKPEEPEIDAVFISHAHADHVNYVSFLHPEIPIHCGEAAHAILKAVNDSGERAIENEIIDYKAAKHVSTQSEVDTDLQLGLYALAFKLTTGKLPLVSFYFLPANVKVTSRRTEDAIRRMRSGLDTIVDRLMSGEHYDPQEGIECKWCDYKRYCPLKTETPLDPPRRDFQPELVFPKRQAAYRY